MEGGFLFDTEVSRSECFSRIEFYIDMEMNRMRQTWAYIFKPAVPSNNSHRLRYHILYWISGY